MKRNWLPWVLALAALACSGPTWRTRQARRRLVPNFPAKAWVTRDN